jgi:hypothetical protein
MSEGRFESDGKVIYLPGARDHIASTRVNSHGKAKDERREHERITMKFGGIPKLADPPEPPPADGFVHGKAVAQRRLKYFLAARLASSDPLDLLGLPDGMGDILLPIIESILNGGERPATIPIPDSYRSQWNAQFESQGLRTDGYQRYMEYWNDLVERSKSLQTIVPPAVARLRHAYDPDPDGAHRPIHLGHLGIHVVACLDCEWFIDAPTFEHLKQVYVDDLADHRSLHWNPPQDDLCQAPHVTSENLQARRKKDLE